MYRFRRLAFALIALFLFAQAPALAASKPPKGPPLKIMTRNVYQGTDFVEVMSATSFPDFLHQVTVTLNNVRATKPPLRMAEIAFEIAGQQPDILALQEVTVWRTGPSPYELETEFDPLQMIVQDLKFLGLHYKVVAVVPEFDFTAPSDTGIWVRTTMQNAILVRDGRDCEDFVVSNPQTGLFPEDHTLSLELPGVPGKIFVYRGWASVDVELKGQQFRFITAHPESFVWQYEVAQVGDLLQGPAATTMPVIMAADFNMRADDSTDPTYIYGYNAVTQYAGFKDAWAALGTAAPGYTCCQLNSLLNPKSMLNQRIDLIFFRGPFMVKSMKVTGDAQVIRNVMGLWPSDHAGVAGQLRFTEQ